MYISGKTFLGIFCPLLEFEGKCKINKLSKAKSFIFNKIINNKDMSTLPELFRPSKSVYIKPNKQGGIFSLKMSKQTNEMDGLLQPEAPTNNLLFKKYSESRVGTSCTTRTEKTRRASSFVGQSRPYSRQSLAGEYKMYDINNYGSSRVSFAIMENAQISNSEADSLRHNLIADLEETDKINEELT